MIAEETIVVPAPDVNSGTLTLRLATRQDRAALIAMYLSFEPKGACLGLPPRKEPHFWLDNISAFPNYVVISNGHVVAHAALCDDGESGEVAVFVHQDFRGRKLGKRLLAALIEEAHRSGLKKIWGITELDNVPMLRLAHALGFSPGADPREFFLAL